MRSHTHARRAGFTLVELLVVIAIIGILMGLLMPAVMYARAVAQRASCTARQRNIAIAIISFENSKQRLPYLSTNEGYAWTAQILEQLGLGKHAQSYANGSLTTNTSVPLNEFKCPSGDVDRPGLSYVANAGTQETGKANTSNPTAEVRGSGLFFVQGSDRTKTYKSSLSSVKDGTGYTILLSERLKTKPASLTANSWQVTASYWQNGGNEQNAKNTVGLTWNSGNISSTSPSNYYPHFPSSKHSNTNNVAFADGSVKGISRTIYYKTYASLMCPDDASVNSSLTYEDDPNFKQ
ncbi:MAG: DUF1559 domain-containing protein [Planctomycetia bacterium]|nr:DUF1559 domain-containing protein [Planctomycetia bacterium]